MASLSDRLRKLERIESTRTRMHRRSFSVVVREGHEEEDQAEALTAIGATVTKSDLVVRFVIVAPAGQSLDDVKPWARLHENNLRKSA